jgi:hypothetical protein
VNIYSVVGTDRADPIDVMADNANQPPTKAKPISPMILALLGVALISVLASLLLPALSGSHKSYFAGIQSNLRQIELAKQMWADDHSITGAVQVSAQDVRPYFHLSPSSNELVKVVVDECYILNPIGIAPEAYLTPSEKLAKRNRYSRSCHGEPAALLYVPRSITQGAGSLTQSTVMQPFQG